MRSFKRRRSLVWDHPKFLRILRSVRVSPQKRTEKGTSVEAGWSELSDELLWLIVGRLGSTADFVRLGGVCRSWRSVVAAAKESFVGGREFPWMMLSDDPNSPTRRFFSLPDGKTYNVLLPEARSLRTCGSTDGWLIMLDIEENMSLLNPLSRTRIPLPHLETLRAGYRQGDGWHPEHELEVFIKKVILSCPPSSDSSDAVALALYASGYQIAFARVGDDKEWCPIASDYGPYDDAVHYKGRFYVVCCDGKVVVCNIRGVGLSNAQLVSPNSPEDPMLYQSQRYLVESSGHLLQVVRSYKLVSRLRTIHKTTKFKVFKLDLGCGKWRKLKSLRGDSLFIGFNQSMSVKASNVPGCRDNCIYFTDDDIVAHGMYSSDIYRMGHDTSIFSLEDRLIQHRFQGYSYSSNSPPLWVVPNIY